MPRDAPSPQDGVEYDPDSEVYSTEYTDWAHPPSEVVVDALTTITDTDVIDLPPLHDVIDPDSLDTLFRPTIQGAHHREGNISFTYCGHHVAVKSYGRIEIRPITDSS